jgi:hypothetical protein
LGFARLEWEYKLGPGNFDFVAQGNYIGDYEDDPNFILGNDLVPSNPGTLNEPNFILHRRVAEYTTLDLQASYEFVRPPLEAPVSGFAKEGKDAQSVLSKQVAVPAADTGTFWQRMLGAPKSQRAWSTRLTGNPRRFSELLTMATIRRSTRSVIVSGTSP